MKKILNLFSNVLKKPLAPADDPSYLSPWYFNEHKPRLVLVNSALTWQFVEKINDEYVGILKLMHNGHCVGVVRSYVYIKPLNDGRQFLVWRRSINRIALLETATLLPISDEEIDVKAIKEAKFDYLFKGEKSELAFHFDPRLESNKFSFPSPFKAIHEVLMLAEIDGLYENPDQNWHNTALVILKPAEDLICVYPQDWFNQDKSIDFGYQWLTRARRDTAKFIRLDGIRMKTHVLDSSHRQLKKFL